MFLPLFIAILLGLASPSNKNHNCHNNGSTTVSSNDGTGDHGGDNGHLPPPKIND